ncbi:hypothetical protein DL93DRAFT_2102496 [Clavulina sp. PMI_390]|nr:hypothetical protein DL93DRAFT_2102496 [Clavulina sp. PMI_390]
MIDSSTPNSASFGHHELQTLMGHLERRKSTSDPRTSQNSVNMSAIYAFPDDSTLKYIDSLNSRQDALRAELDSLRRALATVEAEANRVDAALLRVANRRAPVNKLPEQVLGDIFEWCYVSVHSEYDWQLSDSEIIRVKLLSICHWWFVVATNRVSIWKHIYAPYGLSRPSPDTIMMTRLRLERTKAANIALSVFLVHNIADELGDDPTTPYDLDSLVEKSFPRCESLAIRYGSTPTSHPLVPLPPDQFQNLASLAITWYRDEDDGMEITPLSLLSRDTMYSRLKELSLSIYTYTFYPASALYADIFGLSATNASTIAYLKIDFDRVPNGTWSVLEYFSGLLKLTLCRNTAWQPHSHQDAHAFSGTTSRAISLVSLRIASIDHMPYYSSLLRLKAPHLEELVTVGPMDSRGRMHEEVSRESLSQGLFSLTPPSLLVTLRIESRYINHIPEEHWHNLFAAQKGLEIFQCTCSRVLVEQIQFIPRSLPRLRLLQLGADEVFDVHSKSYVFPIDIQYLAIQLEALRPHISVELSGETPGLRVLVELNKRSDLLLLPQGLPLSRFRVTPFDEPWSIHPAWRLSVPMPASFGHDELQTLIGYLEKRRLTSDPDTSQNAVDVRDYYDASDDSTIKYIDSVNLRQSALLTERDALCRALAAVDEEAKKVDLILTRAANSRALINKIPEEILGDIFEWHLSLVVCGFGKSSFHLDPYPRCIRPLQPRSKDRGHDDPFATEESQGSQYCPLNFSPLWESTG